MKYKKGSYMWAIQEMKKGHFVRQKRAIKELWYFSQNKELLGSNPLGRIFLIRTDVRDCKPHEEVVVFTSSILSNDWISKKEIKLLK